MSKVDLIVPKNANSLPNIQTELRHVKEAMKENQEKDGRIANRVTTLEGDYTTLERRVGGDELIIADHEQRLNTITQEKHVTVNSYEDLPEEGVAGTIYKVSCWNGSANDGEGAVDNTKYSEYAWQDDEYVLLDVKTSIGEIFDISEYNSDTYDDLADALGVDGANIPIDIRRGGMSVKFVQSSDNKYVQYRLMLSTFTAAGFANAANWQGVDDEPTAGSNNLVKSGGVYSEVSRLDQKMIVLASERSLSKWNSGYINSNGELISASNAFHSDYIPISKGFRIIAKLPASNSFSAIAFFTKEGNNYTCVDGVIGSNVSQYVSYSYTAKVDGYIVLSISTFSIIDARAGSSYLIDYDGAFLEDVKVNYSKTVNRTIARNGASSAWANGKSLMIGIHNAQKLWIRAGVNSSIYSFLTSDSIISENPSFVDGTAHLIQEYEGAKIVNIPNGTNYINISITEGTTDMTPLLLKIDGVPIDVPLKHFSEELKNGLEVNNIGAIGVLHKVNFWNDGLFNQNGELVIAARAFHSNYIPIAKGCKVVVNSVASPTINAISFFLKEESGFVYVDGVPGTSIYEYNDYIYKAKEDGYIVLSTSVFSVGDAINNVTYRIDYFKNEITILDNTKYGYSRKAYQATENYIKPWKSILIGTAGKYFTTVNLKRVVDAMVSSGVNRIICQIWNDRGFRWSLNTDDNNPNEMVFVVDGITYNLTLALGDGIGGDGSNSWITRAEMDDFLDYCNTNGIEFVPCFSMPSHMGAILQEFPELAYSTNFGNILDIRDEHACKVAHAILERYVKYFASKNISRVIIGGDEMGEVFTVNKQKYFDFQNDSITIVHYYDCIPVIWCDYMSYTGKNGLLQNKATEVVHWKDAITPEEIVDMGYNVVNANMRRLYWILGESSHISVESVRTFNQFLFDQDHIMQGTHRSHCVGSMLCFWTDDASAHGQDGGTQMVTEILPYIAAWGENMVVYDTSNVINVECSNLATTIQSGSINYLDITIPGSCKIKSLISAIIDNNSSLQVYSITNVSANVVGGYISNGNVRLWFTNISDNSITINANTSVQLKYL